MVGLRISEQGLKLERVTLMGNGEIVHGSETTEREFTVRENGELNML